MSTHACIPADYLRVGNVIDDETLYMLVGHITKGPKWVTVRSFHPAANVYPNTPRRFAHDAYVRIREMTP